MRSLVIIAFCRSHTLRNLTCATLSSSTPQWRRTRYLMSMSFLIFSQTSPDSDVKTCSNVAPMHFAEGRGKLVVTMIASDIIVLFCLLRSSDETFNSALATCLSLWRGFPLQLHHLSLPLTVGAAHQIHSWLIFVSSRPD